MFSRTSVSGVLPYLNRLIHQRSRRRSCRWSERAVASSAAESMESRRLLSAANDLASLSDEFDSAGSVSDWQRLHETENWNADQLQTWDVNQTQAGRMVMAPHTVVWYQNWRGPMAFKNVTGDFVFTTQVHVSDRDDLGIPDADDVPNEAQFSLGGVMIRTPRDISDPAVDWQPGSMQDDGTNAGENYVFLSMGHGTNGNFTFEVKTTRNSDSQLELTPVNSNTASLQLARIGDSIITLLQVPGQDWVVHRRYSRPDMPETIQVGLVSYSDWSKANDFDPFYHNSNVLTQDGLNPTPEEPFNPDIVAGYEYARYFRPQLPAGLDGVDLVNEASDEQLLSFLGESANVPGTVEPPDMPTVSLSTPTATVGESDGSGTFVISRSGSSVEEDLSVEYSIAGTALAGADFIPLSGTAVIPAGSTSVSVDVNVIDDVQVEGTETIEVQLIDQVFYDPGTSDVLLSIADDDFETVGNRSMSSDQDVLTISLPATYPDGTPLDYSAAVVGDAEFVLDQQYDFHSTGNYHENWGGQNERWIRGDGSSWFYLLPGGALHRWDGSFGTSPLIADLDSSVYDDPALLMDVDGTAMAFVSGSELIIDPVDGFTGSFQVDVNKSNGAAESTERITVSVIEVLNDPPTWTAIADQSQSHSAGELRVPFFASDPDGDVLTFSASTAESVLYELDQQYGFTASGSYYDNWGGQNERWINGNNDGTGWFYLLPDGSLHSWTGGFETSLFIGDLDAGVYEDPTRLTEAQAFPVSVSIDGNEIVIAPDTGFVGAFRVDVMATDGHHTVLTDFDVEFTNASPVPDPIGNLVVTTGSSSVSTVLSAADSDGDLLTWSAEVIGNAAYELDAELDLQSATNFYTNWGGHNEKWLRSSSGSWYFILENGDFHRWNGSFANSELLTTLEPSYYEDPNQIADPQPLPVTAFIAGDVLTIDIADGYADAFQVLVRVTDGIETVSQLISVDVEL